VARDASRAAWGSLFAGLASVSVLPLAIYFTRYSSRYELLHAGFAIPLVVVLGLAALALARRDRRRSAVSIVPASGSGVATAGHVLGIVGLCLAASALVALGVYGLLEYVGSRG
jgi:malonyl CoA-acyl carrier protein transacylase